VCPRSAPHDRVPEAAPQSDTSDSERCGPEVDPSIRRSDANPNIDPSIRRSDANPSIDPVLAGKHVVVLGAGFAGIAAARRLRRMGIGRVTLLEARDRVGGRTHSVPPRPPAPVLTGQVSSLPSY
jgi:NADPH-dependent 2,4-dienoyl-CoA reductase/sulfur reductase-like enzyme